jgi:hypothetical protein
MKSKMSLQMPVIRFGEITVKRVRPLGSCRREQGRKDGKVRPPSHPNLLILGRGAHHVADGTRVWLEHPRVFEQQSAVDIKKE